MNNKERFRAGFAGIIGSTNVGKSTILNRLVGYKISIITRKPQTTRNRLLGIINRKDFQIALFDTPGIHLPKDDLGNFMADQVNKTVSDVDVLIFTIDVKKGFTREDLNLIEKLNRYNKPVILALNKIDILSEKKRILSFIDESKRIFDFKEYVPISAKTGENFEALISCIGRLLPFSKKLFSDEDITDRPEHFIVSEIIREELLKQLHQEVPYSAATLINEIKYRAKKKITYIHATVYVEKESQKKIIIGFKGSKIKNIGKISRLKLEEFFGHKVYLDLTVKVFAKWKKRKDILKKLGYNIS